MSGSRRGLYNYSKSDYLCRYGRGLRHEAIENERNDLDLGKGKLYLSKNLVSNGGQLIIRKGTVLTSLFVKSEEPVIMHYGRSKKDGAPGPGTGNYLRNNARTHKDDLIYKSQAVKLIRYICDNDMTGMEMNILKGSYYASRKEDVLEYCKNFDEGELGAKSTDTKIELKITSQKDIQVRSGKDTVKDVVKKIGTKEAKEWFEVLDKEGYFDMTNMYDKFMCWSKSDKTTKARYGLGKAIHEYVYKDRNAFATYYENAGYSAIIDPEDYTYGYVSPVIITNPRDFILLEMYQMR